jgi:hypothetical protein
MNTRKSFAESVTRQYVSAKEATAATTATEEATRDSDATFPEHVLKASKMFCVHPAAPGIDVYAQFRMASEVTKYSSLMPWHWPDHNAAITSFVSAAPGQVGQLKGRHILDATAHVGVDTANLALLFPHASEIRAVELNPAFYDVLARNVRTLRSETAQAPVQLSPQAFAPSRSCPSDVKGDSLATGMDVGGNSPTPKPARHGSVAESRRDDTSMASVTCSCKCARIDCVQGNGVDHLLSHAPNGTKWVLAYLDPPWGGPSYKSHPQTEMGQILTLTDSGGRTWSMRQLIHEALVVRKTADMVVLKAPLQYVLDGPNHSTTVSPSTSTSIGNNEASIVVHVAAPLVPQPRRASILASTTTKQSHMQRHRQGKPAYRLFCMYPRGRVPLPLNPLRAEMLSDI